MPKNAVNYGGQIPIQGDDFQSATIACTAGMDGIDVVLGNVNGSLTALSNNKQNKTDNGLTTTDKTIVGAINELNKVKIFDTIADIQAYTGFVIGDVVQLLGYYSKNDGVGHCRKIEASDDGSGIMVGSLWANLNENIIYSRFMSNKTLQQICNYSINKKLILDTNFEISTNLFLKSNSDITNLKSKITLTNNARIILAKDENDTSYYPSYDLTPYLPGGNTEKLVTSNSPKGSNTINLNDVNGINEGDYVHIKNGYGSMWRIFSSYTNTQDWNKDSVEIFGGQISKVIAKTSNSITIEPPLRFDVSNVPFSFLPIPNEITRQSNVYKLYGFNNSKLDLKVVNNSTLFDQKTIYGCDCFNNDIKIEIEDNSNSESSFLLDSSYGNNIDINVTRCAGFGCNINIFSENNKINAKVNSVCLGDSAFLFSGGANNNILESLFAIKKGGVGKIGMYENASFSNVIKYVNSRNFKYVFAHMWANNSIFETCIGEGCLGGAYISYSRDSVIKTLNSQKCVSLVGEENNIELGIGFYKNKNLTVEYVQVENVIGQSLINITEGNLKLGKLYTTKDLNITGGSFGIVADYIKSTNLLINRLSSYDTLNLGEINIKYLLCTKYTLANGNNVKIFGGLIDATSYCVDQINADYTLFNNVKFKGTILLKGYDADFINNRCAFLNCNVECPTLTDATNKVFKGNLTVFAKGTIYTPIIGNEIKETYVFINNSGTTGGVNGAWVKTTTYIPHTY